jgi:hypothetical protein
MIETRRRTSADWLRPSRVALAAVIIGAASALQSFAMSRMRFPRATLPNELTVHLTFWLVWAASVPLVMRASAAIARTRFTVPAKLACHLIVGMLLSVMNAAVVYGMRLWLGFIGPSVALWREIAGFASWQLSADLLAYGLIAAGYHLSHSYAVARERAAELASARLATLRGQLHPHFLFNTLNSISALVDHDPAEARKAVTLLADLLRSSLAVQDREWVTLGEELRYAEVYLAIEQLRFGDRLRVERFVDDAVLGRVIPSFVLLPLVENAVKHGVGRRRGATCIRLQASTEHGSIVLAVTNTGVWSNEPSTLGTGLPRLRRRLGELYGGDAQLETDDALEEQVRVWIRIPAIATANVRHG